MTDTRSIGRSSHHLRTRTWLEHTSRQSTVFGGLVRLHDIRSDQRAVLNQSLRSTPGPQWRKSGTRDALATDDAGKHSIPHRVLPHGLDGGSEHTLVSLRTGLVLCGHVILAYLPGRNQVSLTVPMTHPQLTLVISAISLMPTRNMPHLRLRRTRFCDRSSRESCYDGLTAAAKLTRFALPSAALPLVAQPMFHNLGVQWACTLLGCLSLLLCAIPVLFYKYGAKLRAMSTLVSVETQP